MKWEVELELEDVFGGDGEVRYEPREQVRLGRTRTKTVVKESTGISVDYVTEEKIKQEKLEPINTFRFDEDGNPTLRLGGAHGKFWGALKAAARQLYNLADEDFKRSYKAVMDMIMVSPVWVPLVTDGDLRVEGIPQVLKGGAGMVVQHFDVVPRAEVTLTLTFPKAIKGKVKKLLELVEMSSHFNKRRTTVRVKGTKSLK